MQANAETTSPATQKTPSAEPPPDAKPRAALFDGRIFWIVTVLLGVQLVLLVANLAFQFRNYAAGIELAREAGASLDNISLILVYSRAWDFAVVKTSALFLGFLVFYTGAIYVLRSAEASYELGLSQGSQLGMTLKTSSPGLVMITFGAGLVALVLYSKSAVELQVSAGPSAAASTISATTTSDAISPSSSPPPLAPPPAPLRKAPAPIPPSQPEDNRVPKLLDAN